MYAEAGRGELSPHAPDAYMYIAWGEGNHLPALIRRGAVGDLREDGRRAPGCPSEACDSHRGERSRAASRSSRARVRFPPLSPAFCNPGVWQAV
eukprot:6167760-Prymnesium_polylepis.2